MNAQNEHLNLALCQEWIELERGWGFRPDGCSLHLSEDDCKKFCEAHWAGMPSSAPDEYSTENGKPYFAIVSEETYERVLAKQEEGGCWVSQTIMPKAVRKATDDEIIQLVLKLQAQKKE